jgi:hypothetical protein
MGVAPPWHSVFCLLSCNNASGMQRLHRQDLEPKGDAPALSI